MKLKLIIIISIVISTTESPFSQTKVNDVKLNNITSLSNPTRYDKYASIAVDAQNKTWVSFTSMQDDKEKILLTSKNDTGWSKEQQIDHGEGIESYSKLLHTKNNSLWIVWQGKRNGIWSIYAKNFFKINGVMKQNYRSHLKIVFTLT